MGRQDFSIKYTPAVLGDTLVRTRPGYLLVKGAGGGDGQAWKSIPQFVNSCSDPSSGFDSLVLFWQRDGGGSQPLIQPKMDLPL